MEPTVTWFLVDETSLSDELRYAAEAVHKANGAASYLKHFRKMFLIEAREAGLLKPDERLIVGYKFNMLAVGRTT